MKFSNIIVLALATIGSQDSFTLANCDACGGVADALPTPAVTTVRPVTDAPIVNTTVTTKTTAPTTTAPPSKTSTKADWEMCQVDTECQNICCTNKYSDDKKFTCTPNACGVKLTKGKAWDFCLKNEECANNCCSNKFSDDNKFKCTPDGC